jgi:hypothetical protein
MSDRKTKADERQSCLHRKGRLSRAASLLVGCGNIRAIGPNFASYFIRHSKPATSPITATLEGKTCSWSKLSGPHFYDRYSPIRRLNQGDVARISVVRRATCFLGCTEEVFSAAPSGRSNNRHVFVVFAPNAKPVIPC